MGSPADPTNPDENTLRHHCHECHGKIGYPAHTAGQSISCPHCGKQTTLGEVYPEQPTQQLKQFCQSCGGKVAYPASSAGERVDCPKCGAEMVLQGNRTPAPVAAPVVSAPPAGAPPLPVGVPPLPAGTPAPAVTVAEPKPAPGSRKPKQGKRTKSPKKLLVILGCVAGGLLMLVAIAGVAWKLHTDKAAKRNQFEAWQEIHAAVAKYDEIAANLLTNQLPNEKNAYTLLVRGYKKGGDNSVKMLKQVTGANEDTQELIDQCLELFELRAEATQLFAAGLQSASLSEVEQNENLMNERLDELWRQRNGYLDRYEELGKSLGVENIDRSQAPVMSGEDGLADRKRLCGQHLEARRLSFQLPDCDAAKKELLTGLEQWLLDRTDETNEVSLGNSTLKTPALLAKFSGQKLPSCPAGEFHSDARVILSCSAHDRGSVKPGAEFEKITLLPTKRPPPQPQFTPTDKREIKKDNKMTVDGEERELVSIATDGVVFRVDGKLQQKRGLDTLTADELLSMGLTPKFDQEVNRLAGASRINARLATVLKPHLEKRWRAETSPLRRLLSRQITFTAMTKINYVRNQLLKYAPGFGEGAMTLEPVVFTGADSGGVNRRAMSSDDIDAEIGRAAARASARVYVTVVERLNSEAQYHARQLYRHAGIKMDLTQGLPYFPTLELENWLTEPVWAGDPAWRKEQASLRVATLLEHMSKRSDVAVPPPTLVAGKPIHIGTVSKVVDFDDIRLRADRYVNETVTVVGEFGAKKNEEKAFELIQYVKSEASQRTIPIVYDQLSSAVRIQVQGQRSLSRTPVKVVGKLRRYNDRNAFYIQASNVIFNP